MIERIEGPIQVGRELSEMVKSSRLYLFVHPNIVAECGSAVEREDFAPGQMKLDSLFSDSHHPILAMEEEHFIEDEVRKASQRRDIKGPRYFLATKQLDPMPVLGWDNLGRIVRNFQPKELVIGGVELGLKSDGSYGMCVGTTYNQLRSIFGDKVKLDLGMCHTRNEELKRIRDSYGGAK